VLYHVGLIEEGDRHLAQTLAISPGHETGLSQLAFCLYHQGRFDEALAPSFQSAQSMGGPWNTYQAALCQLRLGQLEAAEETARMISANVGAHALTSAIRGLAAAARGDFATAREQGRQIVANKADFGHYHHAQYDLACIHALAGEPEAAVEQLAAAAGNGYPCVRFFAKDPLLASLHGTPSFSALLVRLEAEREGYARLYAELQASPGLTASPPP
jgi:tetratricopeptide (TPR) repeat protein